MFCKKCGAQLEAGDIFCVNCGAKVENEATQQTGSLSGMMQPGMTGEWNAAAKSDGLSAGAKVGIGIVATILFLVIGLGGFIGARAIMNRSNRGGVSHSSAKDSSSATDDGNEQDASRGDEGGNGSAAEGSQDSSDKGDFAPKDYWNELTEDQRQRLYCVLSSVYDGHEPNNHNSTIKDQSKGRDYSDPLIDSQESLWYVAYCIVISPGFSNDYGIVRNYKGTVDGMEFITDTIFVSKDDMDDLLEKTVGQTISNPERVYTGSCIQYENGQYLAHLLEDWVNGYTGLLKIEQISEDEVMIYGVTGMGSMHYVYEANYDPHTWHFYREGDYDYTTLTHSYSAKARINPDSPCGLTILGMVYDDSESMRIANEAGFDTFEVGLQSFSPGSNTGANTTGAGSYVLPESDIRKLTEADIAGLSVVQLRIARNEIYARHGRRFQDAELQAYFDSQPWYYGYIDPDDFTDEMLNEVERANTVFLKKEEDKKK